MNGAALLLPVLLLTMSLSVSGYGADSTELAADDSVVWIDLRSASEYRRGHIEGAINIPHGDIGHRILTLVPDTFREVHLYDGSQGTYAGIALEMLMEIGFQEVINEGGYEALLKKLGGNE